MRPKTPTRMLTRRHVLRGAGVALALPWLESLAPRPARGQASAPALRFVPVYFPMGTASFWTPKGAGSGDAWQLSPILEPLTPLKANVTVLSHVDNTAYGATASDPGYARETGSFLTCAAAHGTPAQNATSLDQTIVSRRRGVGLPSLQLGLSTVDSFTDDLPVGFARSISWDSPTNPLFKQIDPQAVFDELVRARLDLLGPSVSDPAMIARRATKKSVLDFVLQNASSVQARLSHTDHIRLDQFMTSVRDLEVRVQGPVAPAGCAPVARPAEAIAIGDLPADYDRDAHANLMIDLMALALACDATRVISFMLDDARSDFVYDFLRTRLFTAAGSTPGTAPVSGYHGLANGGGLMNDGYATINFWFVSKLARLCQQLAVLPEANGRSVLDNSVVWFGSGMHDGANHSFANLPLLYVGSGGGALKVGQHIDFGLDPAPSRRLSDVYLTFLQKVFGLPDTQFGDSQGIVPEILS